MAALVGRYHSKVISVGLVLHDVAVELVPDSGDELDELHYGVEAEQEQDRRDGVALEDSPEEPEDFQQLISPLIITRSCIFPLVFRRISQP